MNAAIGKPMPVRIYALGEIDNGGKLADYGWILDGKTHKRIWEMKRSNVQPAGGADKNVKFDDVLSMNPGTYILYYNTDDSHSCLDWNAAPPSDPLNYGIFFIATDEKNKPDLAIVDLMMENEDSGFILSYKIKKKYPDVPVIIATAVTQETGMVFGLNNKEERSWIKADLYLEKNLRPDQLQREISKLLKE